MLYVHIETRYNSALKSFFFHCADVNFISILCCQEVHRSSPPQSTVYVFTRYMSAGKGKRTKCLESIEVISGFQESVVITYIKFIKERDTI